MTIRTGDDRVVLRDFDRSDIDAYCDWMLPHHDWHKWDGPYFPKPTTSAVERERAALHQRAASDWAIPPDAAPPRRLIVAGADEPERLLGIVTWHWESDETNWPRMGISLFDPAVRGKGIGTAAVRLWTTYLFTHRMFVARGVVRLDYATWSGNQPMLGVGRKLGFTEEARFRDARVVDGHFYDSVVMGVLRSEWSVALD